MNGKNRFKRRRAGVGVTAQPNTPENRNFQDGKMFRICQICIAALVFFSTAAFVVKGFGSETSGPAAAVYRFAGGAAALLLLHLLYGLFCSLFGRPVSLVKRQWLGTFCLYAAVSLYLGMLNSAGLGGTVGLLRPGILGRAAVSLLGGFGSMLLGLALIFLSARLYGHLTTLRVPAPKFRLPRPRLPSLPGRKKSSAPSPAPKDDFSVSGGEGAPDGGRETRRAGFGLVSGLKAVKAAFSELLGRGGGIDRQPDAAGNGGGLTGGASRVAGEGQSAAGDAAARESLAVRARPAPRAAETRTQPFSQAAPLAGTRRQAMPLRRPDAPRRQVSYDRRTESAAPFAETPGALSAQSRPSFGGSTGAAPSERRADVLRPQNAARPQSFYGRVPESAAPATRAETQRPPEAARSSDPIRRTDSAAPSGARDAARRTPFGRQDGQTASASGSQAAFSRPLGAPEQPVSTRRSEFAPSVARTDLPRAAETATPPSAAQSAGKNDAVPAIERPEFTPGRQSAVSPVEQPGPAFAPRAGEPERPAAAGTDILSVGIETPTGGETANAAEGAQRRPASPGVYPPPLDLLGPRQDTREAVDDVQAQSRGMAVIKALGNFGVTSELKRTIIGPTVVQYQIQLAPGVKVSKVSALGSDIAVALGVPSIRVEAPIPGTSYIGVELPNASRRAVPLRRVIGSESFQKTNLVLPLPLGQTVDGRMPVVGLEELPHLLIAGTTGSGKSIFVNNCIVAMCWRNPPERLRFIMIDPKRVEMGVYESLPHILAKPIVTPAAAVHALGWAVREMERRYDACSQAKVRSIASYNEKVPPKDRLPHIVIIVDELADLMMTAQKEVEECIMRLAQMARAVGIHLMLATQRPSVNVLTGTIKANIPARVSFSLPSVADSRTILDMSGAQNLLGKGDMLFVSTRSPHPVRLQSPFMDERTNIRVVDYLRGVFGDPEYVDLEEQGEEPGSRSSDFLDDSRLEEAVKIVLGTGVASSSGLQRQMRIGFTRAARMIDTMEAMGIVGPQNGAKPREILVDESGALEILDRRRG